MGRQSLVFLLLCAAAPKCTADEAEERAAKLLEGLGGSVLRRR